MALECRSPQAGNCHTTAVPFNVYGTRVSAGGGGHRRYQPQWQRCRQIQVSASWANGRGRLAGNAGAGRWSRLITGDRCSGVWRAMRSSSVFKRSGPVP
jgi:hypothetical protein